MARQSQNSNLVSRSDSIFNDFKHGEFKQTDNVCFYLKLSVMAMTNLILPVSNQKPSPDIQNNSLNSQNRLSVDLRGS